MLRALGGDAVGLFWSLLKIFVVIFRSGFLFFFLGMSIVHEVTLASHCGFRTLGLALITNKCLSAYDETVEAVHEDVIRVSELKANELQQLVLDFIGILKANQV